MPEPEVDYEVVSRPGQAGAPPKLRSELIVLPEWKNARGKANAFLQWELGTVEHGKFELSDRVFDEAGRVIRFTHISREIRMLAFTTRDGDGHRVWPTIEAAEEELALVGNSITNKMIGLAQRLNYGDPNAVSADEALKSAEGKSDETSTSS